MFLASNICWVGSGTCHYKVPIMLLCKTSFATRPLASTSESNTALQRKPLSESGTVRARYCCDPREVSGAKPVMKKCKPVAGVCTRCWWGTLICSKKGKHASPSPTPQKQLGTPKSQETRTARRALVKTDLLGIFEGSVGCRGGRGNCLFFKPRGNGTRFTAILRRSQFNLGTRRLVQTKGTNHRRAIEKPIGKPSHCPGKRKQQVTPLIAAETRWFRSP